MTSEERRLVYECFNVHNNGSFRDLMNQLEGKHDIDDRWDVFKKFGDELYDYNKNDRGSVHIDGLNVHELAMEEWQERAKIDFYDPSIYYLKSEDLVDEARTETINEWDEVVF